jgi:hypothetical protein
MIFEISVSEKADKFSFDLWRILKVAVFLAVEMVPSSHDK